MRVSVIIPALNEEGTVADVVRACLADEPLEVLVIDADSTDAGEPDTITPDVPGDGGSTAAGTDLESGSGSDSDDDGHNPPPAGAGQPM